MSTSDAPRTYSTEDAAAYLQLAPGTLTNLRSRGDGPVYCKIGRRVVYRQADLDAWLDAHAVGGGHHG